MYWWGSALRLEGSLYFDDGAMNNPSLPWGAGIESSPDLPSELKDECSPPVIIHRFIAFARCWLVVLRQARDTPEHMQISGVSRNSTLVPVSRLEILELHSRNA